MECTQNTDVFVEVSGILKACASNLFKVANDLRLLSSGPDGGLGEINLPSVQAGSSIMPGKINPVIPESMAQAAMQVVANDQLLTQACMNGNLELNQFMPVVADSLLNSLQLLENASNAFRTKCITGITANAEKCRSQVLNSTTVITALLPKLGYEKCSEIAADVSSQNCSIRELVLRQKLMDEKTFEQLISPEAVNKLGY